MRHADDDIAHAERAAALDDLLQRRDHRLAAVEAETLGAGELHVAEFFEPFGLDQLVEDGALALAGEGDLLVGSLDAFLNPALLRAVGDVQEFDAERLTIGAAQDGDDLAYGAEFETKHLVEKDRTVEIGFAEAVGARIELLLVVQRLQAERIEVGVEVAARAIGANEHERSHRVAGGALDIGGGKLDAAGLRLRLDLAAEQLRRPSPSRRRAPPSVRCGRAAASRACPTRRRARSWRRRGRRPSGSGRTTAIRRRPPWDRPRSARTGLRCTGRCCRRGTR